MILIAVDPGKMCGFFRLAVNVPSMTQPFHQEYEPFTCIRMVDGHLIHNDVHVVVERYTITSTKMTPQTDALEVIGALRYVAKSQGASFTLQSRSEKSRVSNETLRRVGWWCGVVNPHANDAARHALVYLTRNFPEHPIVRQALATI